MDPKLQRQLGELVITSLPTLFLFFFLYFYLRRFFFSRIERVLDERRQATSGTRQAASQSLKRAEAKAAEYEEKLRAARSEIYKEQEAQRQQWRSEQSAALETARRHTDALLKDARTSLEAKAAEAKAALGTESEALAERIAQTILTQSQKNLAPNPPERRRPRGSESVRGRWAASCLNSTPRPRSGAMESV